jgi:hypothetical protein
LAHKGAQTHLNALLPLRHPSTGEYNTPPIGGDVISLVNLNLLEIRIICNIEVILQIIRYDSNFSYRKNLYQIIIDLTRESNDLDDQ